MPRTKQLVLFIILALATLSPIIQTPVNAATSSGTYFDYVVVILLENRGLTQTYGSSCLGNCSYITQLADKYSLAQNYTALVHNSVPNYLALTSGWTQSLQGLNGDCSPWMWSNKYCPNVNPQLNNQFPFAATNLVDRLDLAGKTWKAYMEDYPTSCGYQNSTYCTSGGCFVGYGGPSGNYDNEHDPFVYYDDVRNSNERCARIVQANTSAAGYPDDNLINDLSSTSTASNFMWITPNVCDDMHDVCGGANSQTSSGACTTASAAQCITQGNNYLSTLVPQILSSKIFTTQRAALFITFDEGNHNYPKDLVTTIWAGPSSVVKASYKSSIQYTHYSFLRTVETNWNLQALNQTSDGQATAMTEFLVPPTTTSDFPLTTVIVIAGIIAAAVIASVVVVRSRPHKRSNRAPEPSTSSLA
jgi:phosphatidylinositol-3-phosphatase